MMLIFEDMVCTILAVMELTVPGIGRSLIDKTYFLYFSTIGLSNSRKLLNPETSFL